MNRSVIAVSLIAISMGQTGQGALAGPAVSGPFVGTYEPERMDQPYLPGAGQMRGGLRDVSRAPVGSVQVNVDANGLNIVGDAANEPSIAIDPTNPNRMAIGWRQFDTIASSFRQAGNAYSTDAGAMWTFPGVLTPGLFRSDPVLCADNTGRFFYNSFRDTLCVDVFQSANAGMTWPISVPAFGGDKAWMDVDRTGGKGESILYMAWQTAASCPSGPIGASFTRSTDRGDSWLTPVAIPNNPRFGVTAVGPDGAVYVTGITGASSSFVVAKSTNAQFSGVLPTFDFSVTGDFLGGAPVLGGIPNPAGLLGQVWIAASPLNASNVYLLCSVHAPGADTMDVKFARSLDGGQTWGVPVRVNDDPTNSVAWQWFGTMSVAPNGRIDVVWNDTRDDPLNKLAILYYSFSVDEGVTWAANRPLTPQWDSRIGWPQQNKIGDYYHMISYNDAAHLAYAATFNGEQDVYYMRITPLPTCDTCAGDLNGDSSADGSDIGSFLNCVLRFPVTAPTCGCADMNGDQVIDLNDITPFVERLLLGGCQ
ncbi:MAG: sialidase family protein [Planctomycetota bacterium]